MERLIHEDVPKYDLKYKIILITMPAATFILGLLAYVDGYCCNVFSGVLESESKIAAVVLLATTALVEALYWALLPKRFSIFDDRVEIKFGLRCLNISIERIKEVRPAEGRMFSAGFGCVTSAKNAVEILTKKGINVRISPTNRDLFLKSINKALNPKLSDSSLGKLLLRESVISEEQLNIALDYQAEIGGKIGALLVKLGFVQPNMMMDVLSRTLLIQTADLSKKKIDWDTIKKIDPDLLVRHLVVPVEGESGKVTLVMADPTDMEIIQEIEFVTGLPSTEEIAPQSDIIQTLKRISRPPEDTSVSKDAVTPVAVDEPRPPKENWRDADTEGIIRALTEAFIESGIVTEEKLNEKLKPKETEND